MQLNMRYRMSYVGIPQSYLAGRWDPFSSEGPQEIARNPLDAMLEP